MSNIAVPLLGGYTLALGWGLIYLYKGPDFYYAPGQTVESSPMMNWFMIGLHFEGWKPVLRYENYKEF